MAETEAVLSASDLRRAFDGIVAVDGMSIALHSGEMLGLIGPNGAGKTTLFNLLSGSLKPDSGEILLAGENVEAEAPEKRIARGLARTHQIPKPFAEMTIRENVAAAGQHQSGEHFLTSLFRPGLVAAEERQLAARVDETLEFLSLSHLADQPARVLSGGQRKLLELARVLVADPRVLLLDEPAAGVNPALLDFILERIEQINGRGVSVLLIEHNMECVSRLCSRVVVMAAGGQLASGSPQSVLADPAVAEAYLGDMPARAA